MTTSFFGKTLLSLILVTSLTLISPCRSSFTKSITTIERSFIKKIYKSYEKKYKKYRNDPEVDPRIKHANIEHPKGRHPPIKDKNKPEIGGQKKKEKIDRHKRKVTPHQVQQGVHTIKMYGSVAMEYYYINGFFGTPPQKQSLILDTGSDFTAFPCSTCDSNHCGVHDNPWFNLDSSPSVKKVKRYDKLLNYHCQSGSRKNDNCSFSRRYTENTSDALRGHIYKDVVSLGDGEDSLDSDVSKKRIYKPENFFFGCTENEPPLFKAQKANGIMGLYSRSNSYATFPNVLDIFKNDHQDKTGSFSICISEEGGYLTLGGFNKDRHLPGQKLSTIPYEDNYRILVKSVRRDGTTDNLQSDPMEYILDSGTTYIWLEDTLYNSIVSSVDDFCHESDKNCLGTKYNPIRSCWRANTGHEQDKIDKVISTYPPINFYLGDEEIKISLSPLEYFVVEKESNGMIKVCSSFRNGAQVGETLLGNQFFKNYDFYFDREDEKISFVRSNCNSTDFRMLLLTEKEKEAQKLKESNRMNTSSAENSQISTKSSLSDKVISDDSNVNEKGQQDNDDDEIVSDSTLMIFNYSILVALLLAFFLCYNSRIRSQSSDSGSMTSKSLPGIEDYIMGRNDSEKKGIHIYSNANTSSEYGHEGFGDEGEDEEDDDIHISFDNELSELNIDEHTVIKVD